MSTRTSRPGDDSNTRDSQKKISRGPKQSQRLSPEQQRLVDTVRAMKTDFGVEEARHFCEQYKFSQELVEDALNKEFDEPWTTVGDNRKDTSSRNNSRTSPTSSYTSTSQQRGQGSARGGRGGARGGRGGRGGASVRGGFRSGSDRFVQSPPVNEDGEKDFAESKTSPAERSGRRTFNREQPQKEQQKPTPNPNLRGAWAQNKPVAALLQEKMQAQQQAQAEAAQQAQQQTQQQQTQNRISHPPAEAKRSQQQEQQPLVSQPEVIPAPVKPSEPTWAQKFKSKPAPAPAPAPEPTPVSEPAAVEEPVAAPEEHVVHTQPEPEPQQQAAPVAEPAESSESESQPQSASSQQKSKPERRPQSRPQSRSQGAKQSWKKKENVASPLSDSTPSPVSEAAAAVESLSVSEPVEAQPAVEVPTVAEPVAAPAESVASAPAPEVQVQQPEVSAPVQAPVQQQQQEVEMNMPSQRAPGPVGSSLSPSFSIPSYMNQPSFSSTGRNVMFGYKPVQAQPAAPAPAPETYTQPAAEPVKEASPVQTFTEAPAPVLPVLAPEPVPQPIVAPVPPVGPVPVAAMEQAVQPPFYYPYAADYHMYPPHHYQQGFYHAESSPRSHYGGDKGKTANADAASEAKYDNKARQPYDAQYSKPYGNKYNAPKMPKQPQSQPQQQQQQPQQSQQQQSPVYPGGYAAPSYPPKSTSQANPSYNKQNFGGKGKQNAQAQMQSPYYPPQFFPYPPMYPMYQPAPSAQYGNYRFPPYSQQQPFTGNYSNFGSPDTYGENNYSAGNAAAPYSEQNSYDASSYGQMGASENEWPAQSQDWGKPVAKGTEKAVSMQQSTSASSKPSTSKPSSQNRMAQAQQQQQQQQQQQFQYSQGPMPFTPQYPPMPEYYGSAYQPQQQQFEQQQQQPSGGRYWQ